MKNKKFLPFFLISLFFLIILIRLFLIYLDKDKYENLLSEKTKITINGLSAPRGRILDTNGKVIVDNVGVKTLMYNKIKGIKVNEELNIALKLANIIDIEEAKNDILKKYWLIVNDNGKSLITKEEYEALEERKISNEEIEKLKYERITDDMLEKINKNERKIATIYNLMNEGLAYQKKIILNDLTEEVEAKIVEADIPGITVEMTWKRKYLYGSVMRSILGSIGPINKEEKNKYLENGYELTDIIGRSYLEKEYEDYLKGQKALYKVNSDNTLSLIKEAQKGHDLVLAIDIDIQKKVEEIMQDKILLGKKSYANTEYYRESYAIVSNPKNGQIIALAGQRLNDDGTFSDVATNNLTSSFTIGSAVKGATIAVGYKYHLFEVGKYITDSCVKLYAVPAKCSHKKLGRINDLDALAKSSNYFQFLIAIGLTGNKYHANMKLNATEKHFNLYRDMLKSFGLGAITEIDLPGEITGIKGSNVADDLLLNLAIGQYDTYTPLEVIQYVNSVASGKRMSLSLMSQIGSKDEVIKKQEANILNEVDLESEYLDRIREGMHQVLTLGTGRGYVDSSLNPVGKTGTSQTYIDTDNDETLDLATISSTFAGYFPMDNPKYSIVVITPNVSHHSGVTDYMYYGARRITNDLTSYLNNKRKFLE